MTREEAIKILKAIRVYECYPKSASEETKEAIDMAIEALNSVTDSENGAVESKNDVIKRQDAIEVLTETIAPPSVTLDTLVMRIDALPSAEPQPKPISYIECANAMLKMWIDNVLTDGEYYRIMEKLNSKHMADMRDE